MTMALRWTAQPRQRTFLKHFRDIDGPDEILYGGAAGGGKTDALLIAAYIGCMEMGTDVLYLRRTFPQLKGKPIPRSIELFGSCGKYNQSDHCWTFPNGRKLRFGHCANLGDEQQYKSDEYGIICFDELTDFLEQQYVYILSRNRFVGMRGRPSVLAASNPGSVGHAWVKARWVDPAPPETVWAPPQTIEQIRQKLRQRKRVFIPARVEDNQILMQADPGYVTRLLELPEAMRKALYDGDWDSFAGQAFTELRREVHSFKPFVIPAHWQRFAALDWGYSKPFSVGWYAVDEVNVVRRYREYYGCVPGMPDTGLRMDAADVAAEVLRRSEGERLLYVAGDPSCWSRSGHTGPTIAESFLSLRVPLIKADNERIAGLNQMHERLKEVEIGKDDNKEPIISPRLLVSESCVEWWRTMPALVHDSKKVEDIDTTQEDHVYDETRYACMSRPVSAHAAPQAAPQPGTVEYVRAYSRKAAAKRKRGGGSPIGGQW